MNIILVIDSGIPREPLLIEKESTAKAVYLNIAQTLGCELELHEIMGDNLFAIIDNYLEKTDYSLHWWESPINKF